MDLTETEFQIGNNNLKLSWLILNKNTAKTFKLKKNNLFKLYGIGLLKKHSRPCCYGQKAKQKGY